MQTSRIPEEEILAFALNFIGESRCDIEISTRLLEDLKLAGDEAEEFLKEVQNRFDVSFERLEFSDYFPDEATASMYYALARFSIEKIFWKMFAGKTDYKTLTLADLVCLADRPIGD